MSNYAASNFNPRTILSLNHFYRVPYKFNPREAQIETYYAAYQQTLQWIKANNRSCLWLGWNRAAYSDNVTPARR